MWVPPLFCGCIVFIQRLDSVYCYFNSNYHTSDSKYCKVDSKYRKYHTLDSGYMVFVYMVCEVSGLEFFFIKKKILLCIGSVSMLYLHIIHMEHISTLYILIIYTISNLYLHDINSHQAGGWAIYSQWAYSQSRRTHK